MPAVGQHQAELLPYPQRIWTRYEAADPRQGGEVIIWVEQERIWYGASARNLPNAMLFPPAEYVEVTQVTAFPRSPPVTTIEIKAQNSGTPTRYEFTGFLRLRLSGMAPKKTNATDR
jgi:hypothetical protein